MLSGRRVNMTRPAAVDNTTKEGQKRRIEAKASELMPKQMHDSMIIHAVICQAIAEGYGMAIDDIRADQKEVMDSMLADL